MASQQTGLLSCWQQHGQAVHGAGQLLAAPQPGSTTRCSAATSTQSGTTVLTCTLSWLPRDLDPQGYQLGTETGQAYSRGKILYATAAYDDTFVHPSALAVMHCSSLRHCVQRARHCSLRGVTSAVSSRLEVTHLRSAAWLGSGWGLSTRCTPELSSTYVCSCSLWNTKSRQMQLCGASAAQLLTSQPVAAVRTGTCRVYMATGNKLLWLLVRHAAQPWWPAADAHR